MGSKLRKRAKKAIRVTHKYVGRALAVAAPIAGALVAGPLGAAAGTAVGTAAKAYGEGQGARAKGKKGKSVKKAQRRGAKGGLMIGGAVTGLSVVGAIAGGTGLATSSLTAGKNIFGGSSPTPTGKNTSGDPVSSEPIASIPGVYEPNAIPGAKAPGAKGPAGLIDGLFDIFKGGKDGEDRNRNGIPDNEEKILGLPKPVVAVGAGVLLLVLIMSSGKSHKAA